MKKTIRNLGILLVAQLALAVTLLFSGPDLASIRPDTPLLNLDKAEVDRLEIQGDEDKGVVLRKSEEDWTLSEHFGFPADKNKINGLLTSLKGLKHGMPVATTAGAIKRFKVADDAFERRITLAKGSDELATVFLGTSPGMRRVHARSSQDDAVFSVQFAAHEAPFEAKDWEDKEVLQIPESEIERIQVSGLTLVRQETDKDKETSSKTDGEKTGKKTSGWRAESLEADESLNTEEVETLVRKLANLRIGRVLSLKVEEKYGLNAPKLKLTLSRKGKGDVTYQLGKHSDEEFYVVKTSTRPEYFRIPQYRGKTLVENAARDKLVKAPEKEEPDEEKEEKG